MARHTEDSTLIKRAGDPAILKWKDQQLDHLFDLGELGTSEGRQFLTALETTFSASHLSLGGGGRPVNRHHLPRQGDGRSGQR